MFTSRLHLVSNLSRFTLAAMLGLAASAPVTAMGQNAPPDHDHAAHTAATTAPAGLSLADQVAELKGKVAKLEAALHQGHKQSASGTGGGAASMAPGKQPTGQMGMGTSGRSAMTGTEKGAMGGMSSVSPAQAGGTTGGMDGDQNMMGMMRQMMGKMDQVMGRMGMMDMNMGGSGNMASMPSQRGMSGGGMGMMDDDMMMGRMGGGKQPMGRMQAMSGGGGSGGMGGMAGGGMGKGMMDGDMMMMGMPPAPAMAASALPGFPGASHLYHIGADDFFLNHDQHMTLSTQQRSDLTRAREQALLEKATADRKISEAEQELWTLTAADQPDAAKIEAKVREVEKLRGDQRLGFIRAVGEAAKVLTEEQRKSLLGQLPPQNQRAQPTSGGGMKDM